MLSKVYTSTIVGIEGKIVGVETDISNGISSFLMGGLADIAVREAKERVYAALKNNGFINPSSKVTVNLSPADIKKEGTLFDLPLAIGLLISSGQIIIEEDLNTYIIMGELSLNGELKPVRGVLPMVLDALEKGFENFIVPSSNAQEACLAGGGNVYAAQNLSDAVYHLCGSKKLPKSFYDSSVLMKDANKFDIDMADVHAQHHVKRAMEIAAAGGHNMLMIGPPGSGKTMLAKRFITILPEMSMKESLEVTKIYSVAGLLKNDTPLIVHRPFRAPHHTISPIALVGGGRIPRPGEVSLSHSGVLFLDEFAEFPKCALEVLRQPLEDKSVTISRVNSTMTYPAGFSLMASMNPCPCGYANDPRHKCTCSSYEIERYSNKISGPLMDRIDIVAQVSVEKYENLIDTSTPEETSAEIRERVNKARKIQSERYKNINAECNAQLTSKQVEIYCTPDEAGYELMKTAFDVYGLSARSYHRILKLARTIADLDNSETITSLHLSEALQYRSADNR